MADLIRSRFKPHRTTLRDVAQLVLLETGCSRATAFRWAGEYVDALGLELEPTSVAMREANRKRARRKTLSTTLSNLPRSRRNDHPRPPDRP